MVFRIGLVIFFLSEGSEQIEELSVLSHTKLAKREEKLSAELGDKRDLTC